MYVYSLFSGFRYSDMRPRVLVTLDLPSSILARLTPSCEVTQALVVDQVTSSISGHEVLLCSSFLRVDSDLLDAAGPDLRAVVTVSAGYNHVDTEELRRRGVLLANSQGALEDSVAEIGVSLVLDCLRRVRVEAEKVRQGQWFQTENLFRYTHFL